jgi:hypothetical protein
MEAPSFDSDSSSDDSGVLISSGSVAGFSAGLVSDGSDSAGVVAVSRAIVGD